MIIGYAIVGQDNNSYLYNPDDNALPLCNMCGYIIDFNYISPNFKLNKKSFDISFTYDNRCIVSQKFREFCTKNKYEGIVFRILPNEKNYFNLQINNVIAVDRDNKEYNFEDYCEKCKNYKSITPGFPVMLKKNMSILDGFYRTDLLTGSCNGKSPIFCIGLDTFNKMKRENFKGIHFIKIENNSKPF